MQATVAKSVADAITASAACAPGGVIRAAAAAAIADACAPGGAVHVLVRNSEIRMGNRTARAFNSSVLLVPLLTPAGVPPAGFPSTPEALAALADADADAAVVALFQAYGQLPLKDTAAERLQDLKTFIGAV